MAKTSLVTPILLVGCLIILVSFAIRASFGVFQIPIAQEFGWLRAEFSLAIAIQNLAWGIGQPIFGAIAEKIGDKKAIVIGALVYAAGLIFSSYSSTPGAHQINAFLIGFGIAGTGFLLTPKLGAQRTALTGGVLSALFVLLMVLAGSLGSISLFKTALFLFGAAAGISTNASLTLMLGLTSPLMAGTFIGVWGLAQAYARGLATISGGALLSVFAEFSGSQNSFQAYAGVFVVQALGLLLAGLLLLRVNTDLFQSKVEQALSSVLTSELD